MNTRGRRYRSLSFVIEVTAEPGRACAVGPEGDLLSPRQAVSLLAYSGKASRREGVC